MVRLTVISQTPDEIVLKVEGWVSEAEVPLLEQTLADAFRGTERLVLELKGMKFINRAGIDLLKRWPGERLALRGGASFIRTLLEAHGLGLCEP